MMVKSLAVLAVLLGTAFGIPPQPETMEPRQKKSYEGYKLIRTDPIEDMKTVETLMTLDGLNGKCN